MRNRFRRQPPLPDTVRQQLPLETGERALAWAVSDDGEWYVGTERALYLPGTAGYRRLRWEQVERADWSSAEHALVVVESADWGEREPRTVVRMSRPGRLAELVRERVTKSVVCTVYAPVGEKTGLTVVGRSSPQGEGPVVWSYVLSAGLDPADPEVQQVAARTLTEAKSQIGQ